MDSMRNLTGASMIQRGSCKANITIQEINAFLGLEIATSLTEFGDLKDYWSSKVLLGNVDFKKVISRAVFLDIRSRIKLNPEYDHNLSKADPLLQSWNILQVLAQNSTYVAAPIVIIALVENKIRCKGRITGRTYMPSKPMKFGIRFYAIVGWRNDFLNCFQDNGFGY